MTQPPYPQQAPSPTQELLDRIVGLSFQAQAMAQEIQRLQQENATLRQQNELQQQNLDAHGLPTVPALLLARHRDAQTHDAESEPQASTG